MIDLSIYILSEIFYSRFPDKNAAWATRLNVRETNQAGKNISVRGPDVLKLTQWRANKTK